jgi:hypothetical protein
VVEDERHGATAPHLSLAAELAAALLEPGRVQALLQRTARIVGVADQDLLQWLPSALARACWDRIGIEVLDRYRPVGGPVLERSDVVADRPIAEGSERI